MPGFDWDTLFIWDLSWFTSLGFSWTTSLTGTLGGAAGGMDFLNISAGVLNDSFYPFTSFTCGLGGAILCSSQIKYCAA